MKFLRYNDYRLRLLRAQFGQYERTTGVKTPWIRTLDACLIYRIVYIWTECRFSVLLINKH